MADNSIHFQWETDGFKKFQTGISLHGHTYHSKECLGFIPRYSNAVPILNYLVNRQCDRYQRLQGVPLDFTRGWWTPPLSPEQAHTVEARQIAELGLKPIVSLSDHDSIQAPLDLINSDFNVPVSVEWSVPLHPSFIHLGIHNLPFRIAASLHEQMQAYREFRDPGRLGDVLTHLCSIKDVLIIINHPLWDEPGVGDLPHRTMVADFLHQHKAKIHALELNGLRPWKENLEVKEWADRFRLPVVSGGDRHDTEANPCINLSNSRTFSEFASEVRDGFSHLLFLPSYCTPPGARITQMVVDIMRDHPDHPLGWTRWSDRVFYNTMEFGVRSLSQCMNGNHPRVVRAFAAAAHLLKNQRLKPAVSFMFGGAQECRA